MSEPYAWLGAGAMTLGIGAALAVGVGVAHADDTSAVKAPSSRADSSAPSPRGVTRGSRGSGSSVSLTAASAVDGRTPRAAAGTRVSSAPEVLPVPDHGMPSRVDVVVAATPRSRAAEMPTARTPTRTSSALPSPVARALSTPASTLSASVTVATTATAVGNPAPSAALRPDPGAGSETVLPSAVTAPAARAVPTLPPGLARVLYRIVMGRGLNVPNAPDDPFGALLWGMFRRIETVYGLVPLPGTPTVSTPSLTSGAVSGQVGATVPAELPLGYALVTAPTQGSVTVDSKGYYVYKPNADATASTDIFTVVANTSWAATALTVTVPVGVPATFPGSASDAIDVGLQPIEVAFTPDGRRAYVTGSTDTWTGQGGVSVIDTATKTIVATVGNGAIPTGIAVSADGSTVYVSVYGRGDITPPSVLAVDTTTDAVTAIGAGRFPAGVAVSPDGDRAYVLDTYINEGDDAVWVIDTFTKAVLAKVAVGVDPRGMVASPDGSHLYVLNRGNGSLGSATMSVIDTDPDSATVNTVTAVVKVGNEPVGLAVSPDGKHLYVTDLYEGAVRVIDTATNSVVAKVRLGGTVSGIAVSPDGKRVYVADPQGAVGVIDAVTNTFAGAIPVAGVPEGVAVSRDGSELYVVKYYDQSVSVISV